MRALILGLFAAALLLFAAAGASAFSINHTTSYDGVSKLTTSDTVTVNVFIDSEGAGVATPETNPGINLLSVGVIFTTPNLVYSGGPGGASPYAYLNYYYPPYNYGGYITPTYNGSQSEYMLFTFPQPGTGDFTQLGYAYLIPQQTPWQTWPSPPAGNGQVNLNWVPPGQVPDLSAQLRGTTNTWLGSIVLHVADTTGGSAETEIFVNGSCCAVRTGDGTEHKATTTLDAPTTVLLDAGSEPTPTPTTTPTATATPSATATATATPSATPTATATASAEPTSTPTATPTATATPSATPTPSATATPTATATAMPTPTTTPEPTCRERWAVTTITTIGKGQSPDNNPKVSHSITGHIVDPGSLGDTAHRIPVCRGTDVTADVTDSTGNASNTANSEGILCGSSGCVATNLQATAKYISRSADGKDTDRMTLLPE